jgi:hypothetical protein
MIIFPRKASVLNKNESNIILNYKNAKGFLNRALMA